MSEELQKQTSIAAVAEVRRGNLLDDMAGEYGLSRVVLSDTLKKTIFPSGTATNEQLAAFCAVAHHYDLNPFLKEIYAFPAKGGGVVPIVGVDGWFKLINRHPAMDGLELHESRDKSGNLVAFTCTMWRKDRAHPVTVTEYLAECKRPNDNWRNMPVRMLRHRAIAQCARITFGFGGIYDEYEGAIAAERSPVAASPAIESLNQQIAGTPMAALAPAPVEPAEEPFTENLDSDDAPDLPADGIQGLPLDFA